MSLEFVHFCVDSSVIPYFINQLFYLRMCIAGKVLSFLDQDVLKLLKRCLGCFIGFIASDQVARRILVDHVVEMIIVPEKGVRWLENWEVAEPPTCEASHDGDREGCDQAQNLS